MTQVPLFLTPRQAAARLTEQGMPINEDTVRRWCREELIPTILTPGGQYRIKRKDIDAVLTGQYGKVRVP